MNFLEKAKETAWSVFPVAAIVVLLGIFAVPPDAAPAGWMGRFLAGASLLVVGLTLFLLGVDVGIQPLGERLGAALTVRRKLWLLVGSAFVVGVVVTAAEPDIQVFADQACGVFPAMRKWVLVASIATGVGWFLAFGVCRTAIRFSLKATLFGSYLLLGAIAVFADAPMLGVAFDSGGATTGPMTVPFVMALGMGIATSRAGDRDGGFGLAGVASVGPVLAVLAYSLFLGGGGASSAGGAATSPAGDAAAVAGGPFSAALAAAGHACRESAVSILPLVVLFIVAQATLLRASARQVLRIGMGFLWSFAGLGVFLAGVNGGFMQAGGILGEALGAKAAAGGLVPFFLLLGAGLSFGAIIVCAEPAVWVLGDQVERVSAGAIPRRTLLLFLSAGTALAIALAMSRAVFGFPLSLILLPGYALALLMMVLTPRPYTGIAFDSGGVASGPLTSTFVLSFALGAARAGRGGDDAFGVISLVALMPLLAIQAMGMMVARKSKRNRESSR